MQHHDHTSKTRARRASSETTFLAVLITLTFILLILTLFFTTWKNEKGFGLEQYGKPLTRLGSGLLEAKRAEASVQASTRMLITLSLRDEWLKGPFTTRDAQGRGVYTQGSVDAEAFAERVVSRAQSLLAHAKMRNILLEDPQLTLTWEEGVPRVTLTTRITLAKRTGQEDALPLGMLTSRRVTLDVTPESLRTAVRALAWIDEHGLPWGATSEAYKAYNETTLTLQVRSEWEEILHTPLPEDACVLARTHVPETLRVALLPGEESLIALELPGKPSLYEPLRIPHAARVEDPHQCMLLNRLKEAQGIPPTRHVEGEGCIEGEDVWIRVQDGMIIFSTRKPELPGCARETRIHARYADLTEPLEGEAVRISLARTAAPSVIMREGETRLASLALLITQREVGETRLYVYPRTPLLGPEEQEAVQDYFAQGGSVLILLPLPETLETASQADQAAERIQAELSAPRSVQREGKHITFSPDEVPEGFTLPRVPAVLIRADQPSVEEIPLPLPASVKDTAVWPVRSVDHITQCAGSVPESMRSVLGYATHTGLDLVPLPQRFAQGVGVERGFPQPAGDVLTILPGEVLAWSTLLPRRDGTYERVTFLNTRLVREEGFSTRLLNQVFPLAQKTFPAVLTSGERIGAWWLTQETPDAWKGKLGEVILIYHPSEDVVSVYAHLKPGSILEKRVGTAYLGEDLLDMDVLLTRVCKELFRGSLLREDARSICTPGAAQQAFPLGVLTGDVLGSVGTSGNSQAPHLHFEVWSADALRNGERPARNPLCLLPLDAPRCADPACTRIDNVPRSTLYPRDAVEITHVEDTSPEDLERISLSPSSFASVCMLDEAGAAYGGLGGVYACPTKG